jgi:hypothetical protein
MSTDADKRFAALHLENVALLVPLHEVYSLEPVLDIDPIQRSGSSVGGVRSADSWFAVFSLSDDLEPVATLPDTFRICAILARDHIAIAVACRGVSTFAAAVLARHPLPECMITPQSPIRELALHGDQVYCCTSVADLASLLEQTA